MNSNELNFLYIGNFLFPTNGAAAKRVLNIGRVLRLLGHDVFFMGNNELCQPEDKNSDGYYSFDNFVYFCKGLKGKLYQRIDNYYSFPRVKRIIEEIESTGKKINIIIAYHMDYLGMISCIKYCHNKGIIFISDCTEWYDPCQTQRGKLGLSYYNSQLRMLIANKKADGLIAISKYLEDYYKKYTKVIRIPPLDRVNDINFKKKQDDIIRFVYCGSPGKKDNLCEILNAFEKLGCEKKWEFNIVGVNKNFPLIDIRTYSPKVYERFNFFGKVSLDKAQTIIMNSDFTVFIRPENKRYAKAGFPTKFSESFSLGIPVITNLTSDLSDFLNDGENGLVVKESNQQAITESLNRALNLKPLEVLNMKQKASICAMNYFNYFKYTNILEKFIESLL